MRLVVDLIRGRGVEEALSILHFLPKHAARTVEKVLRSAISNLQNKDESGKVDTASVYVKDVFVDVGPTAKRVLPAPMGRAYRVRKRSNHVTIVVAQRAPAKAKAKPAPKPSTREEVAAKPKQAKAARAKKTVTKR
jgi:large subunit ribosomal protein L22